MIDRAKVEKALQILEAAGFGSATVRYEHFRAAYGTARAGDENTEVEILVYSHATLAIGAPDRLKAVMPFCDKFKRGAYSSGEITANGVTPEGIGITVITNETCKRVETIKEVEEDEMVPSGKKVKKLVKIVTFDCE